MWMYVRGAVCTDRWLFFPWRGQSWFARGRRGKGSPRFSGVRFQESWVQRPETPCQKFVRRGGCLQGEAALPGTDSLLWSIAHIAHPSRKCQQMDAIKPLRFSVTGHRYGVWEGWPLCSACGLVFTLCSCKREEKWNVGSPSFPVPQQGEHGRIPKVQEGKGQKNRKRRKAPHACWEHSYFYVILLIIIKSQQNNGSLMKEIWGAQWAKLCFQGKAGLVHCT